MRYLSIALICLFAVWFANCGSSKPGASGPETTHKTEFIQANFSISAGGLSNPATILYQIRARCEGQNCMPNKADLSFHLQSGSNTIYLGSRNLSIQAGEEKYKWPGQEWTNIYDSPPVSGTIKSVTLKWEELTQIANAQNVTGNLSGHHFEWSYQNREPIRVLLSRIEGKASEAN